MSLARLITILLPLLPLETSFHFDQVEGPSFGSEVGLVTGTSGTQYVYRFEKNRNQPLFSWDYAVSQVAADFHIGPKIIARDTANTCMVLEYIKAEKWPAYEDNKVPYHDCMRLLALFHTDASKALQPALSQCPHAPYFPFSKIELITKTVQKGSIPVPSQFYKVSELVSSIFAKLKPWIEKNAILGHHDFHIFNCLYSKERSYIIDWTSAAALADPYHDVASFANIFKKDEQLELLKTYLGKNTLSKEELQHFRLIQFVTTVRVAALCFYEQRKWQLPASDQEKQMIVRDMERLLDSRELCGKSFLTVPYSRNSEQLRMRALLALQECLDNYEETALLLKEFQI